MPAVSPLAKARRRARQEKSTKHEQAQKAIDRHRAEEVKRAVGAKPLSDPLDLVIRQTSEKATVAIAMVHNLQVEVGFLRDELGKAITALRTSNELMLRFIQEPESLHHAQAVVRDYFTHRPEKT